MSIAVLGPVTVDGDDAGLAPRERVVLGVLTVRRGEVVSADVLADALWGGQLPPASWTKVVQGCVVRLRKVLGADAIETSGQGYRLTLSAEELDAYRFERLVEPGPGAAHARRVRSGPLRRRRGACAVAGQGAHRTGAVGARPHRGRPSGGTPPPCRGTAHRCRPPGRALPPSAGRGAGAGCPGAVARTTLDPARAGPVPGRQAGRCAADTAPGQTDVGPRARVGSRAGHRGAGGGDPPPGPVVDRCPAGGAEPGLPVSGSRAVRRGRRRGVLRPRRGGGRMPEPAVGHRCSRRRRTIRIGQVLADPRRRRRNSAT